MKDTNDYSVEKQQIECLRKLPQILTNEQIKRRKGRERNITQQKGQGKGSGKDQKRDKGTPGPLQGRNMWLQWGKQHIECRPETTAYIDQ